MPDIVFPVLLVCGLFAFIILVGIGYTYLWLLWLNARATKCPECRRRGGGELVDREVIDSKSYTHWKDPPSIFGRDAIRRQRVRVTEKTYGDHLRCKHCGHEWIVVAQEMKHGPV